MNRLGSLHVFAKLGELRSFTAAGNYLGISTSAVSKSIGRLEARLGVRLLQRSTRMVTLTQEGEVFLERCRSILRELEAAETELTQSRGAPRGRLRVTVPSIGAVFLPRLAEFSAAYPEVELDIDFSDRIVDLIDEGFDVAIRAGNQSDSRLVSRKIGYYTQIAVAAPQYLKKAGTPCSLDELVEHSCISYRFPSSGRISRWPLRMRDKSVEVALAQSVVVNSLSPQICFAENGRGIACIPDVAIAEQINTGLLVRVLEQYVYGDTPVYVVWPSSSHLNPKSRRFIDFVVEKVSEYFSQYSDT